MKPRLLCSLLLVRLLWSVAMAAEPQSVRLAITDFALAGGDAGGSAAKFAPSPAELSDAVLARLSSEAGLQLVERGNMQRILQELALGPMGLARANGPQVVRAGRLLQADWLLVGTFQQNHRTNFVLAKLLDARTGQLRDLTAVTLEPNSWLAAADELASFVVRHRGATNELKERVFIGIGAFDDLGLHPRHPHFAQDLRTALARHYAGGPVAFVERTQVSSLLDELQLRMSGLAENPTEGSSAQPALVLLDGVYQSFQDTETRINVVLRLEVLGGLMRTVSLKELPGPALDTKVIEAVDSLLKDPGARRTPPGRNAEARAHLMRARQLARVSGNALSMLAGLPPLASFRAQRVPQLNLAIEAYQAVLLLEPEHAEAKFQMGRCLADPQIHRLEQARELWRDVIAGSTNASYRWLSQQFVAESYLEENPRQAAELYAALVRDSVDPAERVKLSYTLVQLHRDLALQDKLSPAEMLVSAEAHWRRVVELAESELNQGVSLVPTQFTVNQAGNFYPAFRGDRQAQQVHVGNVVSNLARDFPRLEPYLVSGFVQWAEEPLAPVWVSWYERLVEEAAQSPERVAQPHRFLQGVLEDNVRILLTRSNQALATFTASIMDRSVRKSLNQRQQDVLDLSLGVIHYRAGRWQEALTAFERVGDREVPLAVRGPWPEGIFASGRAGANACRTNLNPALVKASSIESLPPPRPAYALSGSEILTFRADGQRVWVLDDKNLWKYDLMKRQMRRIDLKLPAGASIICLGPAMERLWLGTAAHGVFAMDVTNYSLTSYSTEQGLPSPKIQSILPWADRVWVGCAGVGARGTLAFLNTKTGRATAFMNDLPTALADAPRRDRIAGSTPSNGAPRITVSRMAQSPAGELWALARTVHRADSSGQRWEELELDVAGPLRDMSVNNRYLALACEEFGGGPATLTRFGGLAIYNIQSRTLRRVARAQGLPSNNTRSVCVDGDKVWVGGDQFIARVDLATARVEQTCQLPAKFKVRHIEAFAGRLWFSAGPSFYALPELESSRTNHTPVLDTNAPYADQLKVFLTLRSMREELKRAYGTTATSEYEQLTEKQCAALRQLASEFPILKPSSEGTNSTPSFVHLTLNQNGEGFDGFRFRNESKEPKQFAWMIVFDAPLGVDWWMEPATPHTWEGFLWKYAPTLQYDNAPWGKAAPESHQILQWTREGTILPGVEYVAWFRVRGKAPLGLHVDFRLLPASSSLSPHRLEQLLGLSGTPKSKD